VQDLSIRRLNIVTVLFTATLGFGPLIGCASLDLRMDTIPVSADYGKVSPRIAPEACSYYTVDNAPDSSQYTVLARYIVQETPTVIASHSANAMIAYACQKAVEKGADAIILDEIGTTNVAGGYARTSPVIKARAIRFKGDLPKAGPEDAVLSVPSPPKRKTYTLTSGDPCTDAIDVLNGRDKHANIKAEEICPEGVAVSTVGIGGKNVRIRSEFRDGKLYRIINAKTGEVIEPPKDNGVRLHSR